MLNKNITNLNETNLDKNFYNSKIVNNKINIINQMVDTLKWHMYPSMELTTKQIEKYNNFVTEIKELKAEAMLLKNDNKDLRAVKTIINNISFNVMAQSSSGFSAIIKNNDVDIIIRQITDKTANPIIKVEFRSEFLARYGYVSCIKQVQEIIDTILEQYSIKITELHLATDIQGYKFTKLDLDRIKCRNRLKTSYSDVFETSHQSGSKFNSMSFGKDDFMLRIYNKTTQIKQIPKASYVEQTRWNSNGLYDKQVDVWRIEIQFRRKHLKTLIGKDGLLDGFEVVLNSIPDLWAYAMSRFTHHDLTDQQCIDMYTQFTMYHGTQIELSQHAINKRYQRAGISELWQTISTFNKFVSQNISKHDEPKKPEKQYVLNAWKGVLSTYTKLMRADFCIDTLCELITDEDALMYEKNGLTMLDSAKLKTIDYINSNKKLFSKHGVVMDGFTEFNLDVKSNLKKAILSMSDVSYQHKFLDTLEARGIDIKAQLNDVSTKIENYEYYGF